MEDQNGGLANLLACSNVCSLVEYPRGCPDPYGAKKRFDLNASRSNGFWKQFMWLDWVTLAAFLLSVVLLVMAFCVYKDRRRRARSVANKSARKGSLWASTSSNNNGRSRSTSRSRSVTRSRSASRERNGNNPNKESSNSSIQTKKKGLFRGMFSKKNNESN